MINESDYATNWNFDGKILMLCDVNNELKL